MSDDERKPRRLQSQTDRDLDGLEARAQREQEQAARRILSSPFGVPILASDDADFTPVRNILEMFAAEFADDPRMEALVVALWRHSANQEQRWRELGDVAGHEVVRNELAEIKEAIIVLQGPDGKNGKVGNLRADVDKMNSRAWGLITFVLAGLLGVGAMLANVGSRFGTVEALANSNAARLGLVENVLFIRSIPQGKVTQP